LDDLSRCQEKGLMFVLGSFFIYIGGAAKKQQRVG